MGMEYPAGYGSLLDRMLRVSAEKGETRTDWRKRPLSRQQIEYALDDVRYLIPLGDKITERLAKLGRLPWIQSEMAAFQEEIIASRTRERSRRVSGLSGLSPRSLAVAREVWRWREAEAQRLDKPARLVLRDDLLVELARRRTADPRQIKALRDWNAATFNGPCRKLPSIFNWPSICRSRNCREPSGAMCPIRSTCSGSSFRPRLRVCAAHSI